MSHGTENSIFVQIACYRDPEIQPTVDDLFAKAAHPERIFAGICFQGNEEDTHRFVLPHQWHDHIRMKIFPAQESKGSGWARQEAQQLIQDEQYTLQIDSHTRFVSGWDKILLSSLHQCRSPKPVISFNPSAYSTSVWQTLAPDEVNINVPDYFHPDGVLVFHGVNYSAKTCDEYPVRGAIVGFPLLFTYSRCFQEVPIDPYIRFKVGEITHSARLFTHGWDVFSIAGNNLFHNYDDVSVRADRYATNSPALLQPSFERARHLLGMTPATHAESIENLDKYALGRIRTLEEYQQFAGIDFKTRTVKQKSRFTLNSHYP